MKNKSEKRVLTENFISVALTQIISYIISLISLPYLSRVLGAEKFGLVFWAQAFMLYFFIITDYGFGLSAVKEISVNRDNKDKINQIFSSIMIVKLCLILLCFIIVSGFVLVIPKFHNEWLLFYMTFFMVIGNAIYPIWYFQGIEHMKYITAMNILAKSIFLLLIFIFIKHQTDYIFVALLNSLGFMISGLLGIYIACKRFGLKLIIPHKEEIIHQFKSSSEFFISRIAVAGYTNTNAFVLGLISNPVMVAYYVSAEKIYNALQGLAGPVSSVLYPYIARNKDIAKYKRLFYPSITVLILLSFLVFIFAKYFILIFFGQELLPAYKVLRIFCITVCLSFTNALIGYPLLAAMGYQKIPNLSVIIAGVFHVIGLFILFEFNKINIYTIAGMTVFAEFMSVSYRILGIKKYKLFSKEIICQK